METCNGKKIEGGYSTKVIGIEIFLLNIFFKTVIEESFATVGKREGDVVRVQMRGTHQDLLV